MFRFIYSFMITLYAFTIISPSFLKRMVVDNKKLQSKKRKKNWGFSALPDELRYRTFPDFKRRVQIPNTFH